MSEQKNKPKKKRRIGGAHIATAVVAVLVAFTVVLNLLAFKQFDNVLTQFFGYSQAVVSGDDKGADVQYVKSAFSGPRELYTYEERLCAQIAQDGATLLKNDGLLPLDQGRQLDLWSCSSVNMVSGGSGSGSGSFELTADLKTGLEQTGFHINETLWNFYKSGGGSGYVRGTGVVNYGRGFDWDLNECPLSVIQADGAVMASIDRSNVAMFVISRTGGEGGDEPRDMAEFGGARGEHYLELSAQEKEIIQFLGESYDSVIILLNSNNAFELGFLKESDTYKNIKAVVNFPGAGRMGAYGLGYFLRGYDADGKEISPSGHLVDTLVYDNFSAPATQNFGDAAFTDEQGNVLMFWGADVKHGTGQYGSGDLDVNEDAGRCPFYFVTYNEGIYIGYRYYETRYEDYVLGRDNVGDFDYAKTVTYPFGFGLSYTTFRWSDFSLSKPDADGNMTAAVTVKNTGSRTGRDVVQLYYQAPYTDYDQANHIEKAAVNRAGFTKTAHLAPGGEERVEIQININEFKSYDDSREGGYVLESGDYYVTVAEDAHMAVNNILKAKGKGDLSKLCETAAVTGVAGQDSAAAYAAVYSAASPVQGDAVRNRFDYANLIDRSDYLSRSNWIAMENNGLRYATSQAEVVCPGEGKNPWGNTHIAACAEIGGQQFRAVIPEGLLEKLTSSDSRITGENKADNSVRPALDQRGELELIDLRGADYDDPRWEELLSQLNTRELEKMVAQCGYCSPEMKSVNKPMVYDLDGPAGLNKVVGHGSWPIGEELYAMTWPSEYILACTWDPELALEMGECVGEDGLYGKVVGWYGPAMNIHRTPFGGRNFEYYSEDPFLSGVMGKNAVQGAARKGMYGFVKHFAVNDQETHRDQNGLVTFCNEQAMREIYFKPFAMTIRDNDVTVNYNEPVRNEKGKIEGYIMRQAQVPATTAIMSSFNRIGPIWAGGNYDLITGVLREEFGFRGFVLTDYDTGNYMNANTKQMLEAGGDAKLNTIGKWDGLHKGGEVNENIAYAKQAAKNVLYTVANSAGMNGFVHGMRYRAGFAYYKLIFISLDVVVGLITAALAVGLIRKRLKAKKAQTGAAR